MFTDAVVDVLQQRRVKKATGRQDEAQARKPGGEVPAWPLCGRWRR